MNKEIEKFLKKKYPKIDFVQKVQTDKINIRGAIVGLEVLVYGDEYTLRIEEIRTSVKGFTNGDGDVIKQLINS